MLLDTESCPHLSGVAEYRQWAKDDLEGPPKHVYSVRFSVDNDADTWSEEITKSGEGRRYSRELGHQYVDNGKVIEYLSGVTNWPVLIKMLRPTRFDIWGRPEDKWKILGAEPVEHGHLVHLGREASHAVAELFISDTFSLPMRWTEVHPLGSGHGAKREVEIEGIHVPEAWKRRVGMDMSEKGELGASSLVEEPLRETR